MLYIFAGFPGKQLAPGSYGLDAGGLAHGVENVEQLAFLNSDPNLQVRQEGGFVIHGSYGERIGSVKYRLSEQLLQDGITWDWFPENFAFGGKVGIYKVTANYLTKDVDYGTGLTQDELLQRNMGTGIPTDLSKLQLLRVHDRTSSWDMYEARWLPGTCPQESHVVHLTWLVTAHEIPEFAYNRIQEIIEEPICELKDLWRYDAHHFSTIRKWDGKPAFVERSN